MNAAQYLSPGIMDTENFPLDDSMLAWAVTYLRDQRPGAVRIERRGDEEWYRGWGGRAVVISRSGPPRLHMFRRYEYTTLERYRGVEVNVVDAFDNFRRTAAQNEERTS